MSWRWPVTIRHELPSGAVLTLRPLRWGDRQEWETLRARSRTWLRPWESTLPGREGATLSFQALRRGQDRAARAGQLLPLGIDVDGRLVGQMQLFDVLWAARRSGSAGYWLAEAATGHGYATWGLAALIDHVLLEAGLHRVEVSIRPDNVSSLAVVARLGLPQEGIARGLMHVDGVWADHQTFAVLAEDLSTGGYAEGGLIARLRRVAR